jgi:hypothetical protein
MHFNRATGFVGADASPFVWGAISTYRRFTTFAIFSNWRILPMQLLEVFLMAGIRHFIVSAFCSLVVSFWALDAFA